MRIFEDDDAGYLAWIDGHQHGFVVNTFRKPDPRYLFLHRASCGTIRGKTARRRDGKDERLSRSARDAGPVPVGVAPIQLRRASAFDPANS